MADDKDVKGVLEGLTDREKKVIKDRFGVDVDPDASLETLAEQFDVTRKKIRAIERNALKRFLKDAVRTSSPNAKCLRCGKKSNDVRIMFCTRSGATYCEDCVENILEGPDD